MMLLMMMIVVKEDVRRRPRSICCMVWVNLKSGVIHKDGEFYGATKQGKFMIEADAMKAGYKMAKEPAAKKHVKTAKVAK